METFISAADVEFSIKKYKESLSYDDAFDFEMEFKLIKLSDKAISKFNKNDRYAVYLSKRFKRHNKYECTHL